MAARGLATDVKHIKTRQSMERAVGRGMVLFVALFSLFLLCGQAAALTTYDDFSSGTIETSKWVIGGSSSYFSVVPGSSQPSGR